MEEDIKAWLEDATKTLSSARTIGGKANTQLNVTKSTISENNSKLTKSNFLLDSTSQLIQLLETIHESVELRLDDRRHIIGVMEKHLNFTLDNLQREFENLRHVRIDPKLLSGDQRSLYDFISTEILDTLLDKQDVLEKARQRYIEHISTQQKLLKTSLERFNTTFNQLETEVNEVSEANWISTLIDENNGFEEEVASLLESLTNHYDQCVRGMRIAEGKEPDISDSEKEELFKVLKNDSIEVPDVLKDLEESFEDIEQRCRKIENYLNSKFFDIKLKYLVQDLNKFGEEELPNVLDQLDKQTVDVQDLSIGINENCDEAEKLIEHYKQFFHSYQSLIQEIIRRKQVQETMEQVFKEAKVKLEALQNDDYKKRENFVKGNGPYLPGDLWDGINDDSPLCNLIIELHQLPDVETGSFTAPITQKQRER